MAQIKTTTFMKFWKPMNDLLRSHGLPEMNFGEARGWWQDHCNQF
jgi:hypothetical protein